MDNRKWIAISKDDGGWYTEVKCPRCGSTVIYNGNYFCVNWNCSCRWALPHPAKKPEDKAVIDKLFDLGYIKTKDYH